MVRTDDVPSACSWIEIGDVLEVAEKAFERPPETLRGVARELIRGAYKLKDRLLLDPGRGKGGECVGDRAEWTRATDSPLSSWEKG